MSSIQSVLYERFHCYSLVWDNTFLTRISTVFVWDSNVETCSSSILVPHSCTHIVSTVRVLMQNWKVGEYCFKEENPVVKTPPPQGPAWKAHGSSIVSIDLAEAKKLIITASTDYCIRLWSMTGRYIGRHGVCMCGRKKEGEGGGGEGRREEGNMLVGMVYARVEGRERGKGEVEREIMHGVCMCARRREGVIDI